MTTATQQSRTQSERLRALRALLPRFRERMREYDATATFPIANFADLHSAGLLALTIPIAQGGDGLWQGTHFAEYYEILETLAAADSSTAQMLQVHSHASGFLAAHASSRQRETYVADIVSSGRLVASVGSEADFTKKTAELWTSELTPTAAGWRLSCTKHFASLGPGADYYLVWVAVPGTGRYAERQLPIIVPRTAPEVELIDNWDTLGMRSTVSWTLKVTDYDVPEDAIVGEPGTWVRNDPRTFTLAYAANHLGAAQGAFEFVRTWVQGRSDLERSEYIRVVLGEMASALFGARSALYAAAHQWEEAGASGFPGERVDHAEMASIQALHLAKQVAIDITSRGFDICGARAAYSGFPLGQYLRDARTFTLHFREEAYMLRVADGVLGNGFSAKGYAGGSTPPEHEPIQQA